MEGDAGFRQGHRLGGVVRGHRLSIVWWGHGLSVGFRWCDSVVGGGAKSNPTPNPNPTTRSQGLPPHRPGLTSSK
jgi:hypothetical protein